MIVAMQNKLKVFSHFPSDLRDDRGYVADNMGYNFITTAQVKGCDIYIIK